MESRPASTWVIVVPVKRLDRAKTRLAAGAGPWRRTLALAMALDTVSAALRSGVVDVVVVSDDPTARREVAELGAYVVADRPDGGINAALVYGAADARRRYGDVGIAALSADLPALRPMELATALDRAGHHERSFVSDHEGTGTVLYTAAPGAAFRPAFGPDSRIAHAASAVLLDVDGLSSLQRDVDTIDDLAIARHLGLGPRTAVIAARLFAASEEPETRAAGA